MNYLTLFILAIFGAFLVGYGFGTIRERDKCHREINALKKQYSDANKAWGEHCKALRERYINDVTELRNKLEVQKHRKETNMKKIIVNERKYYVELDKIHLIYEDDKLVGWYRPNTEEVEVE